MHNWMESDCSYSALNRDAGALIVSTSIVLASVIVNSSVTYNRNNCKIERLSFIEIYFFGIKSGIAQLLLVVLLLILTLLRLTAISNLIGR